MRIWLRFAPLLLAIAVLATGSARSAGQSYTFKISAARDVVRVGSEVRVKIELKNTSEDDISLTGVPWGDKDHPELEGFRPTVKDAQGKEPPLTKWGRLVFGRPTAEDNPPNLTFNAVQAYPLEPWHVHATEVIVSDLYDLTVPGVYTIQILYKPCLFGVPLDRGDKREPAREVKPSITVTVVP
jgi:hypothetical protein